MNNKELRKLAKEKGVFFWQVALELGICETTMTRRLRVPLPEDEEEKIRQIIEKLSAVNTEKASCT